MDETTLPTPEAILRLNLEVIVTSSGKCLSAKTRNKTVLEELLHLGYINPYHAEYGLTYTVLREVWLGKLGAKTSRISDEITRYCPHLSPHEFYDNINHHLTPGHRKIVFWAVESPYQAINAITGQFCNIAFEKLADAFLIASSKK